MSAQNRRESGAAEAAFDPGALRHDNQRSEKIAEVVARQILEDVVERGLEPGTALPPETTMLEQFQVGRASLREALRILEVHGLIRVKLGPGGGPRVADVRSRDFGRTATFFFHAKHAHFRDLLEARLVLEPVMARMAAEQINEAGQERLETILDLAETLLDDPGSRWGHASAAFHSFVAGMSGNPILDLIGGSLNDIHADRVRPIFPLDERRDVLKTHRAIARAIIRGDGPKAENLARRHMEMLARRLRDLGPGILDELIDWH